MKNIFYFFFISVVIFSCGESDTQRKKEIKISLTDFGILVDSQGQIVERKIFKNGTYVLNDSTLDVVTFSTFNQANLIAWFVTKDRKQFEGHLAVRYIVDSSKVFEIYPKYGTSYYKVIYEPALLHLFRETISNFSSDSLKVESSYTSFLDSLYSEFDEKLPNEFLVLKGFELDSVVEKATPNPFQDSSSNSK